MRAARLAGAAATSRCADAAAGPGPAARIRSAWGKPTQARRAAADHAGPPGPRSMPERTQCESAEGGQEMSGDVIVTIALNAALHVDYAVGDAGAEGTRPISKPGYRAGGRGVTVARVLRAVGHDGAAAAGPKAPRPISNPGYRAGGRGVTVARVLRAFGHDVLAAGLAGGVSGELIREELAKSGVPTAFTLIRGESRRIFR